MEENAKLVKNVTSSSSLGNSTNKEKDGNYDEDEDEEMILVSYISTVFELFNSGLFWMYFRKQLGHFPFW